MKFIAIYKANLFESFIQTYRYGDIVPKQNGRYMDMRFVFYHGIGDIAITKDLIKDFVSKAISAKVPLPISDVVIIDESSRSFKVIDKDDLVFDYWRKMVTFE